MWPESRNALRTSTTHPVAWQITEGRRLFCDYQCLGCQVLDSDGNRIGPDLTQVGARLKAAYLDVFLREPEVVTPGTSMRNFGLWGEERAARVAFLESWR